MRSNTRITAMLAGVTMLAAACGGGGGADSTRERLGAAPQAETAVPIASESGEAAAAAVPAQVAQSDPAPIGAPSGTAAAPAQTNGNVAASKASAASNGRGDKSGSVAAAAGPAGRPEAPTRAGAGSGPADAEQASSSPAGGQPAAAGSGAAGAVPGSGALDPGNRTGVTDKEILFGMHLPQSGPVGFLVGKAWHGADAYFRSVNETGGVHSRRIKMVVSDDGYSAQKAAGAIRELVDDKKVFAASCLAGLDQCVVGLEYADAKGVPYLHGGMSEEVLKDKTWAFPVTVSYPHGAVRLADYMFTKRGYTPDRRIGALHVNSPYYTEMANRMEAQLKTYGSKFVERHVAEKDQSDFSAAIIKMQNAKVDTLWFFVDPTLMAKFGAQARALRFQPQYVFSPPAGGELFAAAAGGYLDGAFGLATFADPQWAGAAGFRKTFAASYPDEDPSEFDMLSYVVAQVFVEGLRRAGPDLGRDGFARGLATIDNFDTGVSSPLSYTLRHRTAAANSKLAVWEIKGTKTDQLTGFDF